MASSNDEIQLYRQVDASRKALTPYTQDDVPTWVKQGCDGADAAALERAQAKTQSRSDFGDFSGDPSQRRARSKKRDYAGMSDRSFMKLIQGGASVGYETVGNDDGAMRVRLKKRRP